MTTTTWQFWIDRGGTFTDLVAQPSNGPLLTRKLLSDNPKKYQDAAIWGIRNILGLTPEEPFPSDRLATVKMGTTVATNALLERRGEPTALAITKGFKEALQIAYQNRPQLFSLNITLPNLLYQQVVEIDERVTAQGEVLKPIDLSKVKQDLLTIHQSGIASLAIVLIHSYRYPHHEQQVATLARQIGFTQVSLSHEVSPLPKLVSRGDTTVVDAYLSPILQRYVNQLTQALGEHQLWFMQSHGGLTQAQHFRGKDAILSGPAGGYVGAIKTSALAGFKKVINFDMGGTSTDVSHYAGEYERDFETQIAGVRISVPMLKIHTIAAGGGSLLHFEDQRFQVGPDSAGANPGPACYRQGGPLTITDCNVRLGKLHGRFFPQVFGESGQQPLDEIIVTEKFNELAATITQITGEFYSPIQVAEGFIKVAVEQMANAIKKISVQRGYDLSEYTLCCLGAAAGQHACLVAEALGIKTIFSHPQAGVLSALGMGLAEVRSLHEQAVLTPLAEILRSELEQIFTHLETQGRLDLSPQTASHVVRKVHLRYVGTDSGLWLDFTALEQLPTAFTKAHQQRYGFSRPDQTLILEAVSVEVVGTPNFPSFLEENQPVDRAPLAIVTMVTQGRPQATPVYWRNALPDLLPGPAIVLDQTHTTIVEVGWQLHLTPRQELILTKSHQASSIDLPHLVKLEICNHWLMSIAEQMGATLANTAYSVNIKERLDFSCAIFDESGQLVANAPHIPIHLGSMGDSVQAILQDYATLQPGEVFMVNNPYRGGTHLPDITVVTPVFSPDESQLLGYVASRGHHADVGGITPGSMPPHSQTLREEGIVINPFKLVDQGQLRETEIRQLFAKARNPEQNLADLRAQIAANATGVRELQKMSAHFGQAQVQAYMQAIQDNAKTAVRQLLTTLNGGQFRYELDNGAAIQVNFTCDPQLGTAVIDFTGTSPQQTNNFNAPIAVTKAAILYVLRTLVQKDFPLNAGCLKPIQIIIPPGCLLNPSYPAAVVAGNVEISQYLVDTLYGALGILAASQGTMNNFTFGNARYQYYETIGGGSGAGPGFAGTAAVHTHMTNSRLTDPEVLEWRFPVLVETFAIRSQSGGIGQYRGGDGIIRRIRFRETMTAAILSSHRRVPPYGMAHGQAGQVGRNWIERRDGSQEILGGTATVIMQAGDVFVIETPGGGGYGKASSVSVNFYKGC